MTRRCLVDDLGLPADRVTLDARKFAHEHPAVRAFVAKRAGDPDKGEPINSLPPRGRYCSLHVGQGRGATLWDHDEDVCWLVAYEGFHQTGQPGDAYDVFEAIFARGTLPPTGADFEALFEVTAEDLLEQLERMGVELLEQARAEPGREAMRYWTLEGGQSAMCVDLVIEVDGTAEEGWLGITLPASTPFTEGGVWDIAAALLPPDVTPTPSESMGNRSRRRGEYAYSWSLYRQHA